MHIFLGNSKTLSNVRTVNKICLFFFNELIPKVIIEFSSIMKKFDF